ncbi:PTS sugar transporter subunit IIA [uncultured Brachyspira sp.]|uniref:PTS sugar transporter subunit IIA n=1 Tax=uncultured Brachyspira sp. TaxID=221953 RepID=UPI0026192634|nr:PTS sugar transporter subunit IIA [uncultured Brachyspira sp.]
MLKEMLKEKIQIIEDAENWEEAIKISAKPLLDNNNIEYRYVDSIINNIYKYGPYIVLVDGVAMAHSRPEDGVIKMGMSFLKIKNGIDFYKTENKVYLFFTLAAEDSSSHQDAMSELADILGNDNLVKKIIQEDLTEEEILNLFN